jgi:hypothetical protein
VQHSDYGGNPFATIDFPLIFFVPDAAAQFQRAEFADRPKIATANSARTPA